VVVFNIDQPVMIRERPGKIQKSIPLYLIRRIQSDEQLSGPLLLGEVWILTGEPEVVSGLWAEQKSDSSVGGRWAVLLIDDGDNLSTLKFGDVLLFKVGQRKDSKIIEFFNGLFEHLSIRRFSLGDHQRGSSQQSRKHKQARLKS
jgi:hypothetical protein